MHDGTNDYEKNVNWQNNLKGICTYCDKIWSVECNLLRHAAGYKNNKYNKMQG